MAYYILTRGKCYGPFTQKALPAQWADYVQRKGLLPERLNTLSAHAYAKKLGLAKASYCVVNHSVIPHVANEVIDVRPKPSPTIDRIARISCKDQACACKQS